MRFDWDSRKAGANIQKHRISIEEACTIFADRSILTGYEGRHSTGEDRWISMGLSVAARLLVVAHTWPEPDQDGEETLRIINARRANQRERAAYAERKR